MAYLGFWGLERGRPKGLEGVVVVARGAEDAEGSAGAGRPMAGAEGTGGEEDADGAEATPDTAGSPKVDPPVA